MTDNGKNGNGNFFGLAKYALCSLARTRAVFSATNVSNRLRAKHQKSTTTSQTNLRNLVRFFPSMFYNKLRIGNPSIVPNFIMVCWKYRLQVFYAIVVSNTVQVMYVPILRKISIIQSWMIWVRLSKISLKNKSVFRNRPFWCGVRVIGTIHKDVSFRAEPSSIYAVATFLNHSIKLAQSLNGVKV